MALIKKLQTEGIPITAVGLQEHVKMDWPSTNQVDETISDFARLGVRVMITELDVDVVPATPANRAADVTLNARTATNSDEFAAGLPKANEQALASRYAGLFRIYLKRRADISRVTFWGVTDGDSWLNSPHRTNYPLLFDRAGHPKPAFEEVLRVAHER
jgi:endo-1,4-beta-xylanase